VCVCLCICVCTYIRIYHLNIYVYVSVSSSSIFTYRTTVTCTMRYLRNTCSSTIVINNLQMCSSKFNLTRMFLNSFVVSFLGLMILLHLLVNCLRVVSIDCLYVCRVFFVCVSHQWWTTGLYCVSASSEWSCFHRNKRGFFICVKKRIFFKKNGLTSVPPHLTV
jgi:hypothetical protein